MRAFHVFFHARQIFDALPFLAWHNTQLMRAANQIATLPSIPVASRRRNQAAGCATKPTRPHQGLWRAGNQGCLGPQYWSFWLALFLGSVVFHRI
jgi:hypothetical protein